MAPRPRLRRLLTVLKSAWPTWIALFGILLAVVLGWSTSSTPEEAIRRAGMILQVIGLVTVAFGLSQMRRLFGRPSLAESIGGWFRSVLAVFSKPPSQTISMGASAGSTSVMGSASLTVSPGPDTSLERRVAILESNMTALQEELGAQHRELRDRINRVADDLQREGHQLRESVREIAQRVEEVGVGGLHLEGVGLLWLFLGVVCTSIPAELSTLLTR